MKYSKKNKKIRLPKLSQRGIFIVTTLVIYFILSTSMITETYDIEVGDIAKSDIKASKDIQDQVSTDRLIEEAIKHVQDVYTYDVNASKTATKNIEGLFEEVAKVNSKYPQNKTSDNSKDNMEKKIDDLKDSLKNSNLSDENYMTLLSLNEKELDELKAFLINTINKVFDETTIYENKPQGVVLAQRVITTKFNNSTFPKDVIELGMAIGNAQIKPNFFIDYEKTDALKEEAKKAVKPVIIKKDQIIVKEGEPVTGAQIEVLKELGLLNKDKSLRVVLYASLLVLLLSVILIQWYYLKENCKEIYNEPNKIMVINVLNCISLILARTLYVISPYLIPFACVPILLSILIDEKVSMTINVLNAILISVIVGFNVEIAIIAIINSISAPIILKKVQQRNDILYSCIYIAILNFIFTLTIGYALSNHIAGIIAKAATTAMSSIISGILAIGMLPFLENAFDIVTNIKLLELANPNHPLLKRLLIEAPGTYHHSVLVANLSEMAAEAVGANAILARVSAYYHDVGKIERPYYFKENQFSGDNPHDKISPRLSALIITSHVSDGIKLAKSYKLPTAIQDVIAQHHGDSLVKYFYITMKNQSSNPEEINEEDYKYKGPAPISKESAIVMLADGVEASVRSIPNPTKEKVEQMVDNIFKGRLSENQLDNCDLTFKELQKIKEAFLKVLKGIYHERIEYPLEKLKLEEKKE
ncbi:MAG: HDIG domain-containing protein [Clostridium argentinense]|uniref:HD family phosphohydrolase n=1 Tax=uncultured Clostridium sp. TaxID=59620 RepID=UPI001DA7AF77|nr:HDIG domain-containing metalloprotein [uncultured Clostridium sp.]MBS5823951.1 HDIG domain-containing protein [Clostridium argentinense]MDU1348328.1 HDIG domain-containing protein [Clostridium argentinense]